MSTDVLELQRLQSAYADVVSRRSWAELDRLFLPDITVEVDTVSGSPAKTFTGPTEFIAFVSVACERFDHFQFVVLNSVVEVRGEDATGRIFMCEIRHHADVAGQQRPTGDGWSTAYGLYSDRYRKVGGTWWFAERHYRSLARTGPQAGIFGAPPGLQPIGR
ncbi:MAG TPA: nuclear transport factor 2 family protein [Mycobacteriales bacterium]|nr:nuclear transport factor 2 family protein [Mycobacteriales bacterium]